jgi:hypothetical protein
VTLSVATLDLALTKITEVLNQRERTLRALEARPDRFAYAALFRSNTEPYRTAVKELAAELDRARDGHPSDVEARRTP